MNSKKGISLVGLVVTIIVLLVLAGVSITFILGPNSLSKKTLDGKIDARFGMAMDRIKSRETTLSILEFSDDTDGETVEVFTNKLFTEGILDIDNDFYDKDNYKLYIGLSDDGSFTVGTKRYKYVVEIRELGDDTTVATGPVTFTFNLNGGKHSGSTSDVKKIGNKNQNVSAPTNITRENYVFDGWSPSVPSKFDEDTTFVAKWSSGEIEINFNLNSGNINGDTGPITKRGSFGDPISKPENPTRNNYVFKGWNESVPSIFTKNKTYTAQWEKEKYTIVYNLNGGMYKNSAVNPRFTYEHNEMPDDFKPILEGRHFVGWTPNIGSATKNQTYTAMWSIPMVVEMKKASSSEQLLIPAIIESGRYMLVSVNGGEFVKKTGNYPKISVSGSAGQIIEVKLAGRMTEFSYWDRSIAETNQLYKIIDWGVIGIEKLIFARAHIGLDIPGCENLVGPIPVPRRESFSNIINFNYMFAGCTSLNTPIPKELFRNTINAKTFKYTFTYSTVSGLIPERLFYDAVNVEEFYGTFELCQSLNGTIPAKIFSKNTKVKVFQSVFQSSKNIVGPIPEKLFENNPNVISFNRLFYLCSGLTGSIPYDLFLFSPSAEIFTRVFSYCTNLTGTIPPGLFSANTKAKNFDYVFHECSKLTGIIPAGLFSSNMSAKNFTGSFYGCNKLTGNAPALWSTHSATEYSTCFTNCTALSNRTSIPSAWGGLGT